MQNKTELNVAEMKEPDFLLLAKEVFKRLSAENHQVICVVVSSMNDTDADEFQANMAMATQKLWG